MVLFNPHVKVNQKCPKDMRDNPKQIRFVCSLECLICQMHPVAHHPIILPAEFSHWHGGSLKSPDAWVIPLCVGHHTGTWEERDSLHRDGNETEYLARFGLPPAYDIGIKLWELKHSRTEALKYTRSLLD